jgi:hypothetical protein
MIRTFALSATLCLALAAPALAAPAGDEYLPKVPKAAGKGVIANPEQGAGASVVAPPVRGSGNDTSSDNKAKDSKPNTDAVSIEPVGTSSDSGDDGSTLLSPVILLMIAGVLCVAAGMIVRRRRGTVSERGAEANREQRRKTAPPTPEGEIVGSGEKAS